MTFVWVLALIGSILGGLTLLSLAAATGAPQQAAVAAIAVAPLLLFSRAIEGIRGGTPEQSRANQDTGRAAGGGVDDLPGLPEGHPAIAQRSGMLPLSRSDRTYGVTPHLRP